MERSLSYPIIEEPTKEEFLDFDKKYLDFSRDSKVNRADISKEFRRRKIPGEALKKEFTSNPNLEGGPNPIRMVNLFGKEE